MYDLPRLRYRRSEWESNESSNTLKSQFTDIKNGIINDNDVGTHQCQFDRLLFHQWKAAMQQGQFRYTLEHVQTRIIPGKQRFIAQFNDKRTSKRRKAPTITDIRQPFNPDNFNFTKIKNGEMLFKMCPEEENSTLQDDANLVIINDSPVDVGHVLLVPRVNSCLPQTLNEEALLLALDMMLLSSHRGIRVCWNSLGALASVNHLHFHVFYLDYPLLAEKIRASRLCNGCYEILNESTRGFAFQLHGQTPDSLARVIFKVSSYLTDRQIPHNLCMTRGPTFSPSIEDAVVQEKTSINDSTIRVFLWPKKPMFVFADLKDDPPFVNACIEPAGFLVIKDYESYKDMTEDKANEWLTKYALGETEFNSLKDDISLHLDGKQ